LGAADSSAAGADNRTVGPQTVGGNPFFWGGGDRCANSVWTNPGWVVSTYRVSWWRREVYLCQAV